MQRVAERLTNERPMHHVFRVKAGHTRGGLMKPPREDLQDPSHTTTTNRGREMRNDDRLDQSRAAGVEVERALPVPVGATIKPGRPNNDLTPDEAGEAASEKSGENSGKRPGTFAKGGDPRQGRGPARGAEGRSSTE